MLLTEELDGLVNTTGTHAAGMAHLVVDQTASDGDGDTEVDWQLCPPPGPCAVLSPSWRLVPVDENNNNSHTRSDGGRHAVVVVVEKFGMRHDTKTSGSFSGLGKCV